MWKWITAHKNALMNVLGIAAPVAVGVVTGGVFTAPVLITAAGVVVAKLSASPLDHSTTVEDKIATATQVAKLATAIEAAKK